MNMLTLNQFAQEIHKQARGGGGQAQAPTGAAHIPGAMTSRMLHPTLWSSNPYTGLMMAGGGLGLASGLLSADDDDNKVLRGLAGAGLGLAGTGVLNNMGAFDDAIGAAGRIRGGKPEKTQVSQTKTEGEAKPAGEAKATSAKGAPKALTSQEFLAANQANMSPGEFKDYQKMLARQNQMHQFVEGSAGRLNANTIKQQAIAAEIGARRKMLQGGDAAGMGFMKRLGLKLPFFGSRIR